MFRKLAYNFRKLERKIMDGIGPSKTRFIQGYRMNVVQAIQKKYENKI